MFPWASKIIPLVCPCQDLTEEQYMGGIVAVGMNVFVGVGVIVGVGVGRGVVGVPIGLPFKVQSLNS
jgi:hypothetical protein